MWLDDDNSTTLATALLFVLKIFSPIMALSLTFGVLSKVISSKVGSDVPNDS